LHRRRACGRTDVGALSRPNGQAIDEDDRLEDADAIEELKRRFSTRMVKTPARSVPWGRPSTQMVVSLRFVRRIARQGGEARPHKLTPAQRSASARKAAKARWRKPRVVEITKRAPRPPTPLST
jgi:hypothetical protein